MSAPRRLLVDVAGQSRNWSLPAPGMERLLSDTPDGWECTVIDAATPMQHEAGYAASREAVEAAGSAEVYFGFGITPELFHAAPRLRWVHSAAAGVGRSVFPELKVSEVVFTNSAGVMADPIAEHVLSGILYFARGFDIGRELQERGEWDKAPFTTDAARVRELVECRALIVGTGGVGRAVARRLSALGTHCVGVRRRVGLGTPPGFGQVIDEGALERELPHTDFVVLAAPLTPETRGILSAARMDCLPPRAVVVNVARGALADEAALAERVSRGQIRGAVLDVFLDEPLPADSPIWRERRILVTPHISAVSPRLFWPRALDLFLDNWQRYQRGEPMRNVVDKEAGY